MIRTIDHRYNELNEFSAVDDMMRTVKSRYNESTKASHTAFPTGILPV